MEFFFLLGMIEPHLDIRTRKHQRHQLSGYRLTLDEISSTFYLPSSDVWPMDDRSDPLNGWPIQEVVRVQTIATEDIYGKLYVYLRDLFERFLSRLAQMEVNFELRSAHPTELLRIFQVNKFARIDVCDLGHAAPGTDA